MNALLKKTLVTALLASASLSLQACGPAIDNTSTASPTPPAFDNAAMDALLSEVISSGEHVGVSALVYDEGFTVYEGTFGMADRERDYAVEMDTVWRIYSMTKPVTSVLIMDLQEEGLLDLNDPVSKYIPELANMQVAGADEDGKPKFTPQASPMTVKDLMLHRAGIGYGIFGDINPVETAYGAANLFDLYAARHVRNRLWRHRKSESEICQARQRMPVLVMAVACKLRPQKSKPRQQGKQKANGDGAAQLEQISGLIQKIRPLASSCFNTLVKKIRSCMTDFARLPIRKRKTRLRQMISYESPQPRDGTHNARRGL